jgi:hypothetical protein
VGDDEMLTRTEALKLLGVKKDWWYSEQARTLPIVRLGARVFVRKSALAEWLCAQERPRAARGKGGAA